MPFSCSEYPATCVMQDNVDGVKIAVMQDKKYFSFQLFRGLSWRIERMLWIGFYKNETNEKCLIKLLPKDIVKVIVGMLNNESFGKEFVKGKYICL